MGLTIVTPPTAEPISLALAKQHARILVDDDDAYVATLITAARQLAEVRCNRAFAAQTLAYSLDGFPSAGYCPSRVGWDRRYNPIGSLSPWAVPRIDLPRPPLIDVESIKYLDSAGVEQTLAGWAYRVIPGTPGTVETTASMPWPSTLAGAGSVVVTYQAGFTGDLPAPARLSMLMLIAQWYDRREPIITGSIVADLPWAVETLLESCSWRVAG